MIAPDLLELLRCPLTHQRLLVADQSVLAEASARAMGGSGSLPHFGEGNAHDLAGGAALVSADGTVLYPVFDDIPVLLIEQAIVFRDRSDEREIHV